MPRPSWVSIAALIAAGTAGATDVVAWAETVRQARQRLLEGQYEQAETLLVGTLNRVCAGGVHPSCEATTLESLGAVAFERGRFREAERYYKRSISLWERLGREGREAIAGPLHNLAVTYTQIARYAEAERLYLRSLAIRIESRGPNDPDLASVLSSLCSAQRAMRKYSDAETHCRRAIAILENAGSAVHPMGPPAHLNLALVYADRHDFVSAALWSERALAWAEHTPGLRPSALIQIMLATAEIRIKLSLRDQALEMLERAESLALTYLTEKHPVLARILLLRARALRRENQTAEALKLEARAAEILRSHVRENSIEGVVDISQLGLRTK